MSEGTAGYRTLNMRFSFSILLLGWWMLEQRWMSCGRSYSKPSISVKPREILVPGENATIHCRSGYKGATFNLYIGNKFLRQVEAASYEAVFPINKVKQSDQRRYSCKYCLPDYRCSEFSDTINIQLAEELYHKPSISVSPEKLILGENATIHCQSYSRGATFYLYINTELLQQVQAASYEAVFPINKVKQSDQGRYSCRYCFPGYGCSEISDGINIQLAEESYSKPSISVKPSEILVLGESATIHCTSVYEGAIFFLYIRTELLQQVWAASYEAVFPIDKVKQSDPGRYSCRYCYPGYKCSEISDTINIQLAAQVSPKPSISVDAGGIHTLGESVDIHCNSDNKSHADFYLYKQGASLIQVNNIKSSKAVFLLPYAQRSDGGIYWCAYCFNSISVKQCSNFSDNIYINITDPSLRTPSISVRPSRQVVLDSDVMIECQGPENDLNFSLHKASKLIASQMSEPGTNVTNFVLTMKRLGDAGNYTCQYHHRENPFLWSGPSELAELVVTERSMTIIWAVGTAGLVLALLLLLLAFILYKKRTKGPKIAGRSQVVNTPLGADAKTVCDEVTYGADHDGVTYAVLNQDSLKIKQKPVFDSPPESCVYASVTTGRNKEAH